MIVEINKDLERYQESVVLGLTAKQLLYSFLSVTVGGGVMLFLYPYTGLTIAAYLAIPVVAPIALGGFYSYQGMSFYEMVRRRLYYLFWNKPLTYVSTESSAEIQEWKDKQKEKPSGRRGKKNEIVCR